MSEEGDVESYLVALLQADTAERLRLLRELAPERLPAVVSSLGRHESDGAAATLAAVAYAVEDRAVRKSARRELHRLRGRGIRPPDLTFTAIEPRTPPPELSQVRVRANAIDGSGSRVLWFYGERRLGGAWLAIVVVDEANGLRDLDMTDTTRKRFRGIVDRLERGAGMSWVDLPLDYGLQLVREAIVRTQVVAQSLPRDHAEFRKYFGEATQALERGLIYESISPVAAAFNPQWLNRSSALIGEPEVVGWSLPVPQDFRQRALELAQSTTSRLLVPGATTPELAHRLIRDAAAATLTLEGRQQLKRRVEETAYLFLRSDRRRMAELAVATSVALGDQTIPAESIPLVVFLLAFGLGELVTSETVAGTPASELLVQAVEAAYAQMGTDLPATTSGGLILPR